MELIDLKVGKIVKIISRPSKWNSTLVWENPLDLIYPLIGKIEKFDSTALSISVNGISYGFSIEYTLDLMQETDLVGEYIYVKNNIKSELTVDKFYEITDGMANDDCIVCKSNSGNTAIDVDKRVYKDQSITLVCKELLVSNGLVKLKEKKKPIINYVNKYTFVQEQLIKLVLYKPTDYRIYLGSLNNSGYGANFISSLFPFRIGLEFDIAGAGSRDSDLPNELQELLSKYKRQKNFWFDPTYSGFEGNSEIRISFIGFQGIIKLKKILDIMNKPEYGIRPSEDGGLHIHIDLSTAGIQSCHNKGLQKRSYLLLTKYRNYIYKVFDIPSYSTAEGKSIRERTFFTLGSKSKIAICARYPTIEWRLLNTTFDYTHLVKLIIFCSMMTAAIRNPKSIFDIGRYESIRSY